MRFRKRLSAFILAIVMMVSSISIPGATSYAAPMTGGSTESGQTNGEEEADKATNDGADAGGVSELGDMAALYAATPSVPLEDYLAEQISNRVQQIYIQQYGYKSKNDLLKIIKAVMYEHPEWYYVKAQAVLGTDRYWFVWCDYNDAQYDSDAFDKAVEEALTCVSDDMSDLEKAVVLHDYLAVNTEYDYEEYLTETVSDASFTAYGPLVNHKAVCEGYALAYKYLLNKVGVDCYMVMSESMNHAWNMVKLNGKYYHVDVTGDDPSWDMVGRVNHDYMFFSDSSYSEKYYGWSVIADSRIVDYKATDTTYDRTFFKNSRAPLVIRGDACYYLSLDGKLMKAGMSDVKDEGVCLLSIDNWPTWDGTGTYSVAFSGLYMIDGRLYYNDNKCIYSVTEDGEDVRTEFTAKTTDGYIYGSAYRGGEVNYCLHKNPNLTERETVLTATLTGSVEPGPDPQPEVVEVDLSTLSETVEKWNIDNLDLGSYTNIDKIPKGDWNIPTDDPEEYTTTLKSSMSGWDDTWQDGFNELYRQILVFVPYGIKAAEVEMLRDLVSLGTDDSHVIVRLCESSNGGDLGKAVIEELRNKNGLESFPYAPYVKQYVYSRWLYYTGTGKASDNVKAYGQKVQETHPEFQIDHGKITVYYIDGYNKIQYGHVGAKSIDEVKNILRAYCDYGDYNIRYVLNGGTNDYRNPKNANGERDVTLVDPTYSDDFQFEGWFLDPEYTKKVTKIPAGTRSEITLYAKWSLKEDAVGYYSIRYEMDGGINGNNPLKYNSKMDNITLQDPEKSGYRFDGWYLDSAFREKITEIDTKNGRDITLYAKWKKNGVDRNNKSYKWTALDGSELSSARSGEKPKVLIFGNYSCGFSEATVKSISSKSEWFQGADIYYVSIYNGPSDPGKTPTSYVENLKAACEGDCVTFTKGGGDGGGGTTEQAYVYANTVGYQIKAWPLLVYIDKNNKIQRADTGPGNSNSARYTLDCLREYCDYDMSLIEYELGGGTNSDENPKAYTSSTETIVLKAPVRRGYSFVGWYSDARYTKQVTEIPQGSSGDITLYAKWRINSPSGDNLTQEYTTLGDETVSSTANGRPKLLIFHDQNAYSQITFMNLASNLENPDSVLHGVDIYAIEASQASKETEETFKKNKANDNNEIVWSYDTTTGNQDKADEYWAASGGESTTINYPLIVYIDADNRRQYVTESKSTYAKVKDIIANLKEYCNYPLETTETYSITYELDGGVNDEANPATYTTESETIVLKDAVKEGFVFEGWYKDAAFAEKVVQIAKGSTGNITLYAKWTARTAGTYSITYELDGGVNDEANPATYTTESETIVLKNAVKEGFVFEGWYKDAAFSEKVVQIAKGSTGDITLYAKWTARTAGTYNITYELDGGVNDEANPATYTTESETIVLKDAVKEGFVFEGWYKDAAFAEKVTEIPAGSTGDITLYAKWTAQTTETYSITYELDGGVNDEANPATYTTESETIVLKDAVKEGFVFDGWYKDAAFAEKVTEIPAGSTGDITLYAKWTAQTTETYSITYELDGGVNDLANPVTYTSESETIVLKNAVKEGFLFDGWYKDAAFAEKVTEIPRGSAGDITLYAKWRGISEEGFDFQEIPDQRYTGKAIKPVFNVYDDGTLLKAGKDYKIKYFNNINANTELKRGNGEGDNFNENLPYVEITGKGNYKNTLKVNFNILPLSIGDGENPSAGTVLKMKDQFIASTSPVKITVSLKCGKSLKKDKDFSVRIEAVPGRSFDASGSAVSGSISDKAEIPAGYTGEFRLVISGAANYVGSIEKTVYVSDKDHSMQKAKITLGKNLKNVDFTGGPISLTGSKTKGDDVFTVQIGSEILDPATDYRVIPTNGSVGKQELIIEGMGRYVGRQKAAFNVKGKAFSNSTVSIEGVEASMVYTGKAVTQNNASVTYKADSQKLVYGRDYSISYSKNVNKGTAVMVFTGNPKAGYVGNVKKSFKIAAADISSAKRDPSMNSIRVSYSKAGAKPVNEIKLTGVSGMRLINGKDYTLKYKDNKAVTNKAQVTVTGKGNYTGKFDVDFVIEQADLGADNIVADPVAVAYNKNKPESFEYKPAVKLKDGKTTLSAGKDYEVAYLKNTQADYNNYLAKLEAGTVTSEDVPRALITPKEGSNYCLKGAAKAVEVPLQIYQEKLDKKKLKAEVAEAVYTGRQVTPKVSVTYGGQTLKEGVDYVLVYGANNKAGKNKGSVTIRGLAPKYGGSVTFKFNIIQKDIKY